MEIQALSPETIQDILPPSQRSLSPTDIDTTFKTTTTDLISAPLGARILHHTDDFFAASSNLINPDPPVSKPGVFIETGAWYDGWETRRHNAHPPDHVTIRLGPAAGIVKGIEIDTAFFTGNYAEEIEVLAIYEPSLNDADARITSSKYSAGWFPLLGRRKCGPSQRHAWFVEKDAEDKPVTHIRLCMFPDGGIARFRLYGHAVPVWPASLETEVELSAATNGGLAIAVSDEHYGKGSNLLLPGRGKDMGDGWETKRSRGKHHVDWVIVKLGARGTVQRCIVDTMHFRGNFPSTITVEGLDAGEQGGSQVTVDDQRWVKLVENEACEKDKEHEYRVGQGLADVASTRQFTHMKMIMQPDGGVKRFRVFGQRSS